MSSLDFFSGTDSISSNYVDVTNPGQGLASLDNSGSTDNTADLQAIINHFHGIRTRQIIFFPRGRYLISQDITLNAKLTLRGSEDGISMIETTPSKAGEIRMESITGTNMGEIDVKHLYFDGVNLRFGKKNKGIKKLIFISHCVFFSRNTPSIPKEEFTVSFHNVTNLASNKNTLQYSVFLQDEHSLRVASSFAFSNGININNNIFGLHLRKMDWLRNEQDFQNNYWQCLIEKLNFLRQQLTNLEDDLGYLESSVYISFSNNTLIKKNVFNGNPRLPQLKRDHVVYVKGFKNVILQQNYARGWPTNASGGIKVRNGKNLVIAKNYIDDTGIILYTHMKAKADKLKYLHLGLEDVLVYGNHLVLRTNLGHRTTGISYYEPHLNGTDPSTDGQDKNLRYSANVFQIVGASNSPPTEVCIFLTNGDQSEHHIYNDNFYWHTTQAVNLQGRHQTPRYETSNISPGLIQPYVNMIVPNYDIPAYQ